MKFVAVFENEEPIYISRALPEVDAHALRHLFGEGQVLDIAHREAIQGKIIEGNVRHVLGAA